MSDERFSVTFRVYGLGRELRNVGGSPLVRAYPPGTTVGDALRDIGIAHEAEVSVLIGGRVVSAEALLEPGDELLAGVYKIFVHSLMQLASSKQVTLYDLPRHGQRWVIQMLAASVWY